jgi:hypothetical protein
MNSIRVVLFVIVPFILTRPAVAQDAPEPLANPQASVLDRATWKEVDASVERGLAWLATQQKKDGSFDTLDSGQPGITSLCLMAFMAQGENPANGKYQEQLGNALNFIAEQQKANGLIAMTAPNGVPIPRHGFGKAIGSPSVYNHAISALALCEAYGQCHPEQAEQLTPIIEKAIAATVEMQNWGPKRKQNVGGWRYLDMRYPGKYSDLSVTGWQLMFLRSAKNAGFDVPEKSIDAAVKYVEGCFLKQRDRRVHAYLAGNQFACTRAMAGAGILALAHAGKSGSMEARASGDWILKHDFANYNDDTHKYAPSVWFDRYHYGAVLCSQAMFQLGGKYWKQFYPTLVETLLANQQPDGAWPPEKNEPEYGECYSTSLSILSLSVPNQMLPIFQR